MLVDNDRGRAGAGTPGIYRLAEIGNVPVFREIEIGLLPTSMPQFCARVLLCLLTTVFDTYFTAILPAISVAVS